MKQRWKRVRYQFEYIGLRLLVALVRLMPRRLCAVAARAMGRMAFALDRKGRRVALENLEAAFGDRYSDSDRRRIARQSYETFARTMFDLFWAARLTAGNVSRYMEFEGLEVFSRPDDEKTGMVMFTPHYGVFEWSSIGIGRRVEPLSVVAGEFKNPHLEGIFNQLRSIGRVEMMPQAKSMIRMLKSVKRGGSVGLLPDLTMRLHQPAVILDAFGLKMRATMLHAVLVHRTGCRLIGVLCHPRADGTCLFKAYPALDIPPGTSVPEIAQRVWDFIEPHIIEHPELWMWSYKHWRYKPRDAERLYPSYANESSQFERELNDPDKHAALARHP